MVIIVHTSQKGEKSIAGDSLAGDFAKDKQDLVERLTAIQFPVTSDGSMKVTSVRFVACVRRCEGAI
jgi:hypothetical protein